MTRKFQKRKVYVKKIDEIWAADLVDMSSLAKFNKGTKFLLSVIDIFSKYGWLVPLKDKKGESVAKAFEKIFKERKPNKIWVDEGKEFYNQHVKALTDLYSTKNEEKSSVIERWNRTMKEKMYKYFSANSTRVYINILDQMVDQYNSTKHSSIKMTPKEASLKKNENRVYLNLYPVNEQNKPANLLFSIGDKVRLVKKKRFFEKGYTPRWTEEIFTVSNVQYTNPPTYKITDYNGEEIQGTLYGPEMQKTTQDVFRIEKIIRKKGNKSLVKWLGYPDSFNSWVDNKDLLEL